MDFSEDFSQATVIVQTYQPGVITINNKNFKKAVVITPERITEDFLPQKMEEINEEHINRLCQSGAEVILLGTGEKQQLLPKNLFIAAAKLNKTIDVMNTAAACRTFSVLSTDGRMVIAALIP